MTKIEQVFIGLIILVLVIGGFILAVGCQSNEVISRTSTGYGWINVEEFTVTATGTAGSASGSQTSDGRVRGHIYGMYLDFASSISTTTDITISTNTAPTAYALIATDIVTDGWYYPVVEQDDSTGSGTSTYDRLPVAEFLKAEVAESTATDVLTVTIYFGQ